MRFIRAVRENEDLNRRVDALGSGGSLAELVTIGREAGFDFTEAELRDAHARDWSLRWVRYSGPANSDTDGR
jgi:predicted ribosomally synthesized peptide with nif11-like leader